MQWQHKLVLPQLSKGTSLSSTFQQWKFETISKSKSHLSKLVETSGNKAFMTSHDSKHSWLISRPFTVEENSSLWTHGSMTFPTEIIELSPSSWLDQRQIHPGNCRNRSATATTPELVQGLVEKIDCHCKIFQVTVSRKCQDLYLNFTPFHLESHNTCWPSPQRTSLCPMTCEALKLFPTVSLDWWYCF